MFVEPGADGTLHIVLRGELDILSVEALQPEIAAALAYEASLVVVDAAELTYVDSSGLAVLLRLSRRYGDLEVRHASNIVRQAIGAAGLAVPLRLVTAQRPDRRRQFPAELLSVRESRTFVLEALRDVERAVRELAAVLVAELATNAVLHAKSAILITADIVRAEVADEGPGTPVLVDPDLDSEMGRGLKMVDGLASRWGVQSRTGDESKTVWFELRRPDPAAGLRQDSGELDTTP
jgi:anti-anti-sigma factor